MSTESPMKTARNDKEDRYADLLTHASGLKAHQHLFISFKSTHRDFAFRVGKAGFMRKAGSVTYLPTEGDRQEQLIRYGTSESIVRYFEDRRKIQGRIAGSGGVLIILIDSLEPEEWSDRVSHLHPENYMTFLRKRSEFEAAFRPYPFVVSPIASARWARRIFPEVSEEEAVDQLWEHLFRFTFADRADALEHLAIQEEEKELRIGKLNDLDIREIHIVGGETDCRVGFSEKARWTGSLLRTKAGHEFHVNFPSWEIFTTPNQRRVEGRIAASMPFRIQRDGQLVSGLVMEFEGGRVVAFDATAGRDEFASLLETDERARCLGEFALVDLGSPVGQSRIYFDQIYLDENAASHVALGQGLQFCLEDGENLSEVELENLGCNHSKIHTDIIFGSPEVSIIATRSREGEVMLIDRGRWSDRFHSKRSTAQP